MSSAPEHPQKKSITIFAVIHDDVSESTRATIYENYFHPFVKNIESFTNRKINVVFWRDAPPYSSYDYQGENTAWIAQQWARLSIDLLKELGEKGFDIDSNSKIVLVTDKNINSAVGGVAANSPGFSAIASTTGYRNIGHEVGHLLGATHEDGETQYNAWWGDTYMKVSETPLTSNTYTFSPANQINIINHLAKKP